MAPEDNASSFLGNSIKGASHKTLPGVEVNVIRGTLSSFLGISPSSVCAVFSTCHKHCWPLQGPRPSVTRHGTSCGGEGFLSSSFHSGASGLASPSVIGICQGEWTEFAKQGSVFLN